MLAIVLLAGWPSPAEAHRPQPAGSELTVVPDLETSYAFYRTLEGGLIHRYLVAPVEEERLDAGVSIPDLEGLAGYEVWLALVGPGLPTGSDVPFEVPPGLGVVVAPPTDAGEFFEPFTQTRYRTGQRITQDLIAGQTYALVVWSEAEGPGKYVLDSGREERFGPTDLLRFPGWWVSVNAYFGHWWRLAAAGMVGAGLLTLAVRRLLRSVSQRRASRLAVSSG